jgi:hypothetical protein
MKDFKPNYSKCLDRSAEIEETKPQNFPKADAYLLADVRAVLEDIVEGEYRLFHSDSMDQNTGLEEKTRLLYEKVKRAF